MALFSNKCLVMLFFCLITVGQAHPFATVYAMSHGHAQCSCNKSGRKCIHGCDLKQRKSSSKMSSHTGGHDHGHHSHAQMQVNEDLSDTPTTQFVSPNCSKQHQQKILSFQGDPFLLQGGQWISTSIISYKLNCKVVLPQEILLACDERPPKTDDSSDA